MPITFVPNPNGAILGPGIQVSWSSDFIGPLPEGSQWEVDLRGDGGAEAVWINAILGTQSPFGGHYTPWAQALNFGWATTTNLANTIRDGSQASFSVTLRTPTGAVDSGTLQGTWDARSGIAQDLEGTGGGQGGFTASDRQLITATDQRTKLLGELGDLIVQTASGPVQMTLAQLFSRSTLDRLTLQELTSGETCDPVRVDISFSWFHAIVVRVTTIAEDLRPKTPDGEWYFPDLAVLRIFRGQDLEYRRGIHTPTFIQERPWQWGWQFLNVVPILGAPPETIVAVDWRQGCCGQVFGMFLN